MLIAAGQGTPLVVLVVFSPLLFVLMLLWFLRRRSQILRAGLFYGVLGFVAAFVVMGVATSGALPNSWLANNRGWCAVVALVTGTFLGALLGVLSRV